MSARKKLFSKNIKYLRNVLKNDTQREFAAGLGVTRSPVSSWEDGRAMPPLGTPYLFYEYTGYDLATDEKVFEGDIDRTLFTQFSDSLDSANGYFQKAAKKQEEAFALIVKAKEQVEIAKEKMSSKKILTQEGGVNEN